MCPGEGEGEGVGERSIVIDQAVEFLQALLDLLTELQLHLGVSTTGGTYLALLVCW